MQKFSPANLFPFPVHSGYASIDQSYYIATSCDIDCRGHTILMRGTLLTVGSFP